MSKALKIFGIVVGVLIILFIVAGILLTRLIDPNQYKTQISHEVFQATGHTLKINGKISWSFFPWLGLKVNDVALGNAKGFGNDDMATVKEADVKVSVLPLFFHKVTVNNITLNKLELNLIKNSAGIGNWETSTAKSSTNLPDEKQNSVSSPNFSIEVDNIDIDGGNIHWQNNQNGQDITLKNIDIHGKDIQFNNPFSITISSDIVGANPKINTHIDISGDFDINGGFSRFSLTNFSASLGKLTMKGSVTGGMKNNELNYAGNMSIEKFNPKDWLTTFGVTPINTANTSALTSFAGAINFTGTNNSFMMNKIKLDLDKSELTGSLAVQNFDSQALRFQLLVDQFNADDYLPVTQKGGSKSSSNPSTTTQDLPIAMLRKLNIIGSMTIKNLTMMKLNMTDATVSINAQNGLINVAPIKANLYSGSTNTTISYNVRSAVPSLTVNSNTQGIQLQPLMKDFVGIDKISGKTDFSLNTTSTGANTISLTNTLNGNGKFSLTNGKINGINLAYQLQRAQAMISKSAQPSSPSSNDTDIGLARGTVKITNGIATNNDLIVQTTVASATGQGNINLPAQSMDYTLYLTPTSNGGALQGQKVPFHISGNFSNLNYNLDVSALVAAIAKQQAKQAIQKQLGDSDLGKKGQQLLNNLFNQ